MLADTIRNANTEHEIYSLLTSYIETVRVSKELQVIPEPITRLPLNGVADLRTRFTQLMLELDRASKSLDNNSCTTIKEGVHAQAAADHLALSLDERLARSWALYCANRDAVNVAAREDDPSAFYERARKLGLYRE